MNRLLASTSLALVFPCAAPAFGQSCANSLPIAAVGVYAGNSCAAHARFPNLANGAIAVPSSESVYAVSQLSTISETFQLQSDPGLALSLFICRNPCSTYASCVAVADVDASGTSPLLTLNNPTDYFVVVGSTAGNCGGFTLFVGAPLND